MLRNNWDGIDRRNQWDGSDRRRANRYDELDSPVIERERIIEVAQSQSQSPQSSQPKWLSPGITMPIIFSLLMSIGGFVFTLYNKVASLEYKQSTIFEKMDDLKQTDLELKGMFKDQEIVKQKLLDRISSIEETVMESLRHKQQ